MITALLCLGALAIDGDTLKCVTGERIRLNGIESNEIKGGCHLPVCPAMPAKQAKDALQQLIGLNALHCDVTGRSFKRLTAWCRLPDGVDLSCQQIHDGAAWRWAKFDPKGRLKGCER